MWIIENIVALTGAGLLVAGCTLLARKSTTTWASALIASTVAFLVVAVGAELYMQHGEASPGFSAFMVDYQSMLAVVLFFVASLSFFMVARNIRRPN